MPDLPQSGGSWIRDPKTGALAPNVPPAAEPAPAEPASDPEPAAPTDDGTGADPVPQASGRTRKKG